MLGGPENLWGSGPFCIPEFSGAKPGPAPTFPLKPQKPFADSLPPLTQIQIQANRQKLLSIPRRKAARLTQAVPKAQCTSLHTESPTPHSAWPRTQQLLMSFGKPWSGTLLKNTLRMSQLKS